MVDVELIAAAQELEAQAHGLEVQMHAFRAKKLANRGAP